MAGDDENGKATWDLIVETGDRLYSDNPISTVEFANRLGQCLPLMHLLENMVGTDGSDRILQIFRRKMRRYS